MATAFEENHTMGWECVDCGMEVSGFTSWISCQSAADDHTCPEEDCG